MRSTNIKAPRPKYMIDHTSRFRMIWDLTIVTLVIVNMFLIPLEVSFTPPFTKEPGFIAFDYLFDLIFLLDLIFNFRTSFNDEHGEKIFNKNRIAWRYVKSV